MNAKAYLVCSDCPLWMSKMTGRCPIEFHSNTCNRVKFSRAIEVADGGVADAQPIGMLGEQP